MPQKQILTSGKYLQIQAPLTMKNNNSMDFHNQSFTVARSSVSHNRTTLYSICQNSSLSLITNDANSSASTKLRSVITVCVLREENFTLVLPRKLKHMKHLFFIKQEQYMTPVVFRFKYNMYSLGKISFGHELYDKISKMLINGDITQLRLL